MPARILLSFVLAVTAFAASPTFRPDAYLRHVKYLASDELAGRGNGTPELDRAAEYIAGQFRASGLEPAGDGGSFFQKLEVTTGSKLGPGNKLTLEVGQLETSAVLSRIDAGRTHPHTPAELSYTISTRLAVQRRDQGDRLFRALGQGDDVVVRVRLLVGVARRS